MANTAPVIGEINSRGVPNNQWDVYWWQQEHQNDVTNPSGQTGQQTGISMYGSPAEVQGESAGRQNASIYYGTSDQLGADSADYRSRIKSKVGESSGLANRLTQSANSDISRANTKAGLKGVDTTAASIRERRNSMAKADEIQQSADQVNLANYGKSIGAGISGTEALAAAGAGRALAATPTPTPSYGGGLSIICTELHRQGKLNSRDMIGSREFRDSLSEETYNGYLIIAKPIVKLMKRSDKFSNLFVGWAKAISRQEPNKFTLFMIPICNVIGKIHVRGILYAR